jgi:glycerol kinase
MEQYILAFDQGTTSSRSIIFTKSGTEIANVQKEFQQVYPRPGWVEHDPEEIWSTQLATAHAAIKKAQLLPDQIAGLGITNQRETTILWDRTTGKPIYNALVWQCRRTTELCQVLKEKGLEPLFTAKTGLILDPYFSGTKVTWLFQQLPELSAQAKNGNLCFGTVDSWLIYKLTGQHLTDPSNASRTLLFNIHTGQWDDELLDILKIPRSILPKILPSSGDFGKTKKELFRKELKICGVAGDQQAALFGQACFKEGMAKNTYGTGCFTLVQTGKKAIISKNKLLTTIAWDIGDGLEYALEGAVFIAGAVIQWLRDQLKIIKTASETAALANSVPDTGGVYFIPAFVGLGAPFWDPEVRGTIVGLTRGTTQAHIVRAALESIAFQVNDLLETFEKECNHIIPQLKVDGGASQNTFLMQFQADILGIPVITANTSDTTALGAAYLAGLSCGYWKDKKEIENNWKKNHSYHPQIPDQGKNELIEGWKNALKTALVFKSNSNSLPKN